MVTSGTSTLGKAAFRPVMSLMPGPWAGFMEAAASEEAIVVRRLAVVHCCASESWRESWSKLTRREGVAETLKLENCNGHGRANSLKTRANTVNVTNRRGVSEKGAHK